MDHRDQEVLYSSENGGLVSLRKRRLTCSTLPQLLSTRVWSYCRSLAKNTTIYCKCWKTLANPQKQQVATRSTVRCVKRKRSPLSHIRMWMRHQSWDLPLIDFKSISSAADAWNWLQSSRFRKSSTSGNFCDRNRPLKKNHHLPMKLKILAQMRAWFTTWAQSQFTLYVWFSFGVYFFILFFSD